MKFRKKNCVYQLRLKILDINGNLLEEVGKYGIFNLSVRILNVFTFEVIP